MKYNLNLMDIKGEDDFSQLDTLKSVGWDGFFSGWTDIYVNEKLADHAAKIGLKYQSIHAKIGRVDKLWDDGEDGDEEVKNQIDCISGAKTLGIDLVILHTIIGMEKCSPTALGVERYGKIFEHAKKLGVTVALENTEGEIYLETLINAYKNEDTVRFCIDTGHEMCYNHNSDLITKYADKLVCTHINDNLGQTGEKITFFDDSHLVPFDGVADWRGVAKRLNKAGYRGDITLELIRYSRPNRNTHDIYGDMSCHDYFALALERAKIISSMLDVK